MSTDKKTILVTGGAGFIGSFLCEELLKEGNRVICVDDFSTGHVRNIEPYLRNPDFQFFNISPPGVLLASLFGNDFILVNFFAGCVQN